MQPRESASASSDWWDAFEGGREVVRRPGRPCGGPETWAGAGASSSARVSVQGRGLAGQTRMDDVDGRQAIHWRILGHSGIGGARNPPV